MMKLSVVIISYNVKFHLEQCLNSVFRALREIEGDVYVVDNNSQDDSVEYLRKRFPQVHYVENPTNSGFASANNIALKQIESEYVLLLNPDTFIGEDTLRQCIGLMDSDPTIGACGVRILNLNGTFAKESRRGVPTPTTAFFHMSGLSRLFPRNKTIGKYHMMYLNEMEPSPIEILSGAYMFIRSSVLKETGLFDETFFMYGEDIDLSYRILLSGHRNYYIPTRILHYKGESTKKNTFKYVKTFYEAMYIFFQKHYSHYSWCLSLPIKTAILIKGSIEYARRKFKAVFTKQEPDSVSLSRLRIVFDISEENAKAIEDLCNENSLTFERFFPTPECPSPEFADFIVFDTSKYSYQEILERMDSIPAHKNHPNIATYSPETGHILLGSTIL